MYQCSNIKPAKIAHAIPEILQAPLEKLEICLAGGACRRFFGLEDNEDWDLFVIPDKKEKTKTKDLLEGWLICNNFVKTFQCEADELRSYKKDDIKIQLIDLKDSLYS